MAITYRLTKGLPLTNTEIDGNFQHIEDTLDTKLDASDYNGTEILALLAEVQGHESGLNADTVDELHPETTNVSTSIVARDSSGNFAAGTITAALTGNVTGDVKSTNGTTVLDSGTDGTNATFTGTVNGVTLDADASGFNITGGSNIKVLTVANTLTLSGTDNSSVAFGTGGTVAYTAGKLSQFASTSSSELRSTISDETGTGSLVFAASPSLTTPSLGAATATSINKLAITAPLTSATLTILNGKTLTANNSVTLSGTDGATVAFGSGGTVAYTGATLAQFAATTSTQLADLISDETGTGALVFASNPALSQPIIASPVITYAAFASVADADLQIDANAASRFSWISAFTANRVLSVSNLIAGREIKVFIRNTNGTARNPTIQCRTGTSGAYTPITIIARSAAASTTNIPLAASSGTAYVTIVNIAGNFYANC